MIVALGIRNAFILDYGLGEKFYHHIWIKHVLACSGNPMFEEEEAI